MARSKSHPVALSQSERQMLVRFVRTGSHRAQEVRRARILLELDENDPGRRGALPAQEQVAERAGVHVSTVSGHLEGIRRAWRRRRGDDQAQEAAHRAGGAEGDRRGRGQADRAGLLRATGRPCTLVAATSGEAGERVKSFV